MHAYELTLAEASAAIAGGELSPVALLESVLARTEQVEGRINAFATRTAEQARHAARQAEQDLAQGRHLGPLHGIPVGVKDIIDTAGVPTTSGSRVRAGRVPEHDATVVRRLSWAGAVLVGKTHTDEFAYGVTTPQTNNPWLSGHSPGGSSGGSAAAVATGMATFALGTDTAGSTRIPAALSGVTGLKPTAGLLPRYGITPLSWSLDHVGVLTRTAADAALVLGMLAGHDQRDTASLAAPGEDYGRLLGQDLHRLRIGVPENHYFDRARPEVEHAVRTAIGALAELGATVVPVRAPMAELVLPVLWGLMVPEASAYHDETVRQVPDRYGEGVRRMLEAGSFALATDYLRAQRVRTLMRAAWLELFTQVDLVATPTVPATAVRTGTDAIDWPDGTTEPVSSAYTRLTAAANLAGLPAVSVPVGLDGFGLPIGLQLIGPPLGEPVLLQVADGYQRARAGWCALAALS
ncbi:amidase family protein [Crossiella sp. SN42]|uniref:amidase n=1 Tax=Crossiella sp. SN42 TaxID=2944808 RepID=UPI00207C9FB4|nr:amidase [Crossiella sp. SN42]MCO1574579.1 amidase family protein [Crossiella sp. SN42]